MMSHDKLPLTRVSFELAQMIGRPGPTHRKIWEGVVNGQLPAEMVGNRYFVKREDLPEIARKLGLMPAEGLVAA